VEYLVKPVERDELIRIFGDIEKENGIEIIKALVVDDNPADVEFIAASIEDPGSNGRVVLKAYGGVEGLKLARKHRPDLIILDLIMPDMDGFEIIKKLRQSEKTKDIPVLIVTAKKLSKEEQEFLRENIQYIMIKGEFTKEDLLEGVKETLKRLGKR
jgi:CheY-like chemotaxis protein